MMPRLVFLLSLILVSIFQLAQSQTLQTVDNIPTSTSPNQDAVQSIPESKVELQQISAEMKTSVLALLKLIKEIESNPPIDALEVAKVIVPEAAVRETETLESSIIFQADREDELTILEKRETVIQVHLEDGRTGWISDRDVQILSRAVEKKPPSTLQNLFSYAARAMQDIEQDKTRAEKLSANLLQNFLQLSNEEKELIKIDYQAAVIARSAIGQYYETATRFFSPYASYAERAIPLSIAQPDHSSLNGQISLNVGKSAYESAKEHSESSRNIQANVTYLLNERSRLIANLGHRKEVMQTPFSTTDLTLGYSHRMQNGLRIDSRLGYLAYDDTNLDRNDFGQITADMQMEVALKQGPRLFGNITHINKNFSQKGGNDFAATQFNTNALFKNNKSETTYSLRGLLQQSDISYLHFNQFTPRMRYLHRKTPQSNFGIIAELDYIGYAEEAKNNSYFKEKIDLQWAQYSSTQQRQQIAGLVVKQFPNNSQFNYARLSGDLSWRSGIAGMGTSTSASAILNLFTDADTPQTHFIDLRVDRNRIMEKYFIDLSLCNRLWSEIDANKQQDHQLDLYSQAGPVFTNHQLGPISVNRLKVGFIIGSHILYGSGGDFLKKNGNSLRFGIGFDTSMRWKKTIGIFSGSFEKSVVYGNEIAVNSMTGQMDFGELVHRSPTFFQFRCETRTPISRDWDLAFNLSHYSIQPDVNDKTSINPLESLSKFKLFLGLVYRF